MDRTTPMMIPSGVATPWPIAARAPAREVLREAPPQFERVFAQYAPYVGRTLRFLGVDDANVEDVCQEVFIIVHRRLREIESSSPLRAWIRQICVHTAQNERRRARRRRERATDSTDNDVPTAAQQHGSVELREMRERLLVLLEQMTEDQRAVFVLYEIEQLPMAEVAAAVGCPLQTAYSRLHAARARIAEAVAQREVPR